MNKLFPALAAIAGIGFVIIGAALAPFVGEAQFQNAKLLLVGTIGLF